MERMTTTKPARVVVKNQARDLPPSAEDWVALYRKQAPKRPLHTATKIALQLLHSALGDGHPRDSLRGLARETRVAQSTMLRVMHELAEFGAFKVSEDGDTTVYTAVWPPTPARN